MACDFGCPTHCTKPQGPGPGGLSTHSTHGAIHRMPAGCSCNPPGHGAQASRCTPQLMLGTRNGSRNGCCTDHITATAASEPQLQLFELLQSPPCGAPAQASAFFGGRPLPRVDFGVTGSAPVGVLLLEALGVLTARLGVSASASAAAASFGPCRTGSGGQKQQQQQGGQASTTGTDPGRQ